MPKNKAKNIPNLKMQLRSASSTSASSKRRTFRNRVPLFGNWHGRRRRLPTEAKLFELISSLMKALIALDPKNVFDSPLFEKYSQLIAYRRGLLSEARRNAAYELEGIQIIDRAKIPQPHNRKLSFERSALTDDMNGITVK